MEGKTKVSEGQESTRSNAGLDATAITVNMSGITNRENKAQLLRSSAGKLWKIKFNK